MSHHITQRVRNVAATMTRNAETLEHNAPLMGCPQARRVMIAEAIAWRQVAQALVGDISMEVPHDVLA